MIPGANGSFENMGVEAWLERSIAHRIHVPALWSPRPLICFWIVRKGLPALFRYVIC